MGTHGVSTGESFRLAPTEDGLAVGGADAAAGSTPSALFAGFCFAGFSLGGFGDVDTGWLWARRGAAASAAWLPGGFRLGGVAPVAARLVPDLSTQRPQKGVGDGEMGYEWSTDMI